MHRGEAEEETRRGQDCCWAGKWTEVRGEETPPPNHHNPLHLDVLLDRLHALQLHLLLDADLVPNVQQLPQGVVDAAHQGGGQDLTAEKHLVRPQAAQRPTLPA